MNPLETWLSTRACLNSHRQLLVISGEKQWCYTQAQLICTSFGQKHLWLGDSDFFTARGYPLKQYQKCLGVECDVAIYDGHTYFNASAFLSLSGTVKRHGLLILCVPTLADWSAHHAQTEKRFLSFGAKATESLFIKRWVNALTDDKTVAIHTQDNQLAPFLPISLASAPNDGFTDNTPFSSEEQQAVYRCITANSDGCHIISAKRGRGKSALMGMIATFYARQGRQVTVCSALKHGSVTLKKHYQGHQALFKWFAPDSPLLQQPTDILLIDEIASLPVAVALSITKHASIVIAATTIEGYEGTGRGFTNKLLPQLKNLFTDLHQYSLHTPIRYYDNDSLETHLSQVFMLQPNTAPALVKQATLPRLTTKLLSPAFLSQSDKLPDIIAILTNAHYKTTPEDIMRILDMPDTLLFVTYCSYVPVAASVVITEGGQVLSGLSSEIASGERRLKGHLLPQSMGLLLSNPEAVTMQCWRINRIAVTPALQSKGIGQKLLKDIETFATNQRIDLIGSAFGTADRLLHFWEENQYLPIRLGSKPDAASGEVSTTVVRLLNPKKRNITSDLFSLFQYEKAATHSRATSNCVPINIQAIYRARILDYINHTRSLHHLGNAITWFLNSSHSRDKASLTNLLKALWLEKKEETELIREFKLKGRKALYAKAKSEFEALYWASMG